MRGQLRTSVRAALQAQKRVRARVRRASKLTVRFARSLRTTGVEKDACARERTSDVLG